MFSSCSERSPPVSVVSGEAVARETSRAASVAAAVVAGEAISAIGISDNAAGSPICGRFRLSPGGVSAGPATPSCATAHEATASPSANAANRENVCPLNDAGMLCPMIRSFLL